MVGEYTCLGQSLISGGVPTLHDREICTSHINDRQNGPFPPAQTLYLEVIYSFSLKNII